MTYRDDRGPLALGRLLGRGGQGSVYQLGDEAVKIYAAPPGPRHAKKIQALLSTRTSALEAVAAWPSRLVYSGKTPVGYVMPRIADHHPIGRVFIPASRKREFPDKPWGWLIHVARNVSAAVSLIHANGVVVGDINDANVFVSADAKARFIDVDSFQVALNGDVWNTGVGVPMYLPPELQNRDLSTLARTPNHDHFALAVLIFQLVMMGRHPWGGNYRSDRSIEELISSEPFAFGSAAKARGITVGASAPRMGWLSANVADMFERAFSSSTRPSATEWTSALDEFKSNLTACSVSKTHQFASSQGTCPWCAMEQGASIFYFIPIGATAQAVRSSFQIGALEKEFNALDLPPNVSKDDPRSAPIARGPLPTGYRAHVIAFRILATALVAGVIASAIYGGVGGFIFSGIAALAIYGWTSPTTRIEKAKKDSKARVAAAITSWEQATSQWLNAGARDILEQRESLRKRIGRYKALGQAEIDEMAAMQRRHREIFLDIHLSQFLVRDAQIGLPRNAVRSLESFGIQTAAEIKRLDRTKVPQIGAARTQVLHQWCASLTRRFSYDPKQSLPTWMIQDLKARLDNERRDLEARLPADLFRLKSMLKQWRESGQSREDRIREAAQRVSHERARAAAYDAL